MEKKKQPMIPEEFTKEHIEAKTGEDAFAPYVPYHTGNEPYTSIFRNNPWLYPPDPRKPLTWGQGKYYDTTAARKHEHWKDIDLPRATKDINQLRRDLVEWGYCLIENGLSSEQLSTIRSRVEEQAEAESLAGLSDNSPALRIVWALINKGECFVRCLELDPEGVQGGPVIEQLLDETLGNGWCSYSFLSNIALPDCYPQVLHQDQSFFNPMQTPDLPLLVNVVYLLDDVNEVNGGTLMIPGTHRTISRVKHDEEVGAMPPAINTEAKAGTVMLMDGRLLHGTGVNRSNKARYILTNSNVKSWVRTQENWMVNVKPEVLASASPKLLQRIGFQARVNENITDGFGSHGNGSAGDPKGAIAAFRMAIDRDEFVRVGKMSVDDVKNWQGPEWTAKKIRDALRASKKPPVAK